MADEDILSTTKRLESGGRNILNYLYDPQHTAGGYWQITDTNWKAYAPKAGISTEKYPKAIDAPEDIQHIVASYLLHDTPMGIRNWTDFNPKLKAALAGKTDKMAESQNTQEITAESINSMSLAELDALEKKLQGQIKTEPPKIQPKAQPKVEAPPTLNRANQFFVEHALNPALSASRAFWDPSTKSKISDVYEGLRDPASIIGAGWALASPLKAILPAGLSLAGRNIGMEGSKRVFDADPETQRLAGNVGEAAGGVIGGLGDIGISKLAGSIRGSGGGIPPEFIRLAGELPYIRSIPGARAFTGFMADRAIRTGGSAPAPTGEVKPPTPPTRAESENMLRLRTINDQQFLNHEAARNVDPETAQQHLATAKAKIAEKIKPQQPAAQVPVHLQPDPATLTSSGTPSQNLSVGGTPVNIPPGVRPTPNLGQVGGFAATPSGTSTTTQISPQLPPIPQPPPQMSQASNTGLSPIGDFPPASPTGTPLPVRMPARIPVSGEIIPRTQAIARSIADAAFTKRIPPPRTSNKAVLKGFSKKIGLDTDITGEESKAAREIYDNRIRATRPTASNPGK